MPGFCLSKAVIWNCIHVHSYRKRVVFITGSSWLLSKAILSLLQILVFHILESHCFTSDSDCTQIQGNKQPINYIQI